MHATRHALMVALATAIGISAIPRLCIAVPVFWNPVSGGNGHYYEFIPGNISWTGALADAPIHQHLGAPGYLATITSFQEKEFLRINLAHTRGWIGGFQDTTAPDYSEPGGGWRWITGEPWAYTNWASPEPNQFVPAENFLEIDPAANSADDVGWNDVFNVFVSNQGYYIEYTIPEPSSFVSTILAYLMLVFLGRSPTYK